MQDVFRRKRGPMGGEAGAGAKVCRERCHCMGDKSGSRCSAQVWTHALFKLDATPFISKDSVIMHCIRLHQQGPKSADGICLLHMHCKDSWLRGCSTEMLTHSAVHQLASTILLHSQAVCQASGFIWHTGCAFRPAMMCSSELWLYHTRAGFYHCETCDWGLLLCGWEHGEHITKL